MGGLHRGNHLERRETRQVVAVHHLGVFDAPAVVGVRLRAQHRVVGVEHDAVAAVADGVAGRLDAAAVGLGHARRIRGRLGHQQAAVAGFVAVVLDERGAAAAQRTVHVELHAAHGQPARGMFVGAHRAQRVQGRGITVGVGADAQRQLAGVGETTHQAQVGQGHTHVVHAGQAIRHRGGERALQCFGAQGVVGLRHDGIDQRGGGVDEHAGRLAGFVAQDAATVRLPVAGEVTFDGAQRGAVGPAGVSVHALKPDRPIREGSVQVGGGRELLARPVVLVPAAAQQPGTFGQGRFEGLQAADDFVLAGRVHQVGAQQGETQVHQVGVGINQPGHHGGVAGVMAYRVRVARRKRLRGTDRQHPALRIPGHRLGNWRLAIAGVDALGDKHLLAPGMGQATGRGQADQQANPAHQHLPGNPTKGVRGTIATLTPVLTRAWLHGREPGQGSRRQGRGVAAQQGVDVAAGHTPGGCSPGLRQVH